MSLDKLEEIQKRTERAVPKPLKISERPVKGILVVPDENIEKMRIALEIAKSLCLRYELNTILLLEALRHYEKEAESQNIDLDPFWKALEVECEQFKAEGIEIEHLRTDSFLTPPEQIRVAVREKTIDLVIMPYPFTEFAESYSGRSLGSSIDQLLDDFYLPLLLVKETESEVIELLFRRIGLIFSDKTASQDISHILNFIDHNGTLDVVFFADEPEIEAMGLEEEELTKIMTSKLKSAVRRISKKLEKLSFTDITIEQVVQVDNLGDVFKGFQDRQCHLLCVNLPSDQLDQGHVLEIAKHSPTQILIIYEGAIGSLGAAP